LAAGAAAGAIADIEEAREPPLDGTTSSRISAIEGLDAVGWAAELSWGGFTDLGARRFFDLAC